MATTAIEGPKEVTELLTNLNNKYEAVGARALLLIYHPHSIGIDAHAQGHSLADEAEDDLYVILCRYTRRLRCGTCYSNPPSSHPQTVLVVGG
jgi:hypothetical protein